MTGRINRRHISICSQPVNCPFRLQDFAKSTEPLDVTPSRTLSANSARGDTRRHMFGDQICDQTWMAILLIGIEYPKVYYCLCTSAPKKRGLEAIHVGCAVAQNRFHRAYGYMFTTTSVFSSTFRRVRCMPCLARRLWSPDGEQGARAS